MESEVMPKETVVPKNAVVVDPLSPISSDDEGDSGTVDRAGMYNIAMEAAMVTYNSTGNANNSSIASSSRRGVSDERMELLGNLQWLKRKVRRSDPSYLHTDVSDTVRALVARMLADEAARDAGRAIVARMREDDVAR